MTVTLFCAVSRIQSPESRVQSPESRVQNPESAARYILRLRVSLPFCLPALPRTPSLPGAAIRRLQNVAAWHMHLAGSGIDRWYRTSGKPYQHPHLRFATPKPPIVYGYVYAPTPPPRESAHVRQAAERTTIYLAVVQMQRIQMITPFQAIPREASVTRRCL